uniref:Uncharacterized protein n=1 Tax=Timema poppense TaxID=170557 RepID=A0A7R9HB47_TIMPO|nr:unnamed protein product [Timema poppensis]
MQLEPGDLSARINSRITPRYTNEHILTSKFRRWLFANPKPFLYSLLKTSQNHPYFIAMQFVDLLEKFRETGSVLDAKQRGRPSKLNHEKLLDISDSAYDSIQIISQAGTRRSYRLVTAHKGVREKLKLVPYKTSKPSLEPNLNIPESHIFLHKVMYFGGYTRNEQGKN